MQKRKTSSLIEEPPLLLTVPQAAEMLSVGKDMVYTYIKTGSLPAIDMAQPGQRAKLRISRSALDAWIEQRQRQQNPYHDLLMTRQADERQTGRIKRARKGIA